jgi:RNA-splicing ligase RtcB
MSLKYFAQQIGPAHYVLPRTHAMRVDAHAFFSETLFERTEESMWQQLASAAAYPGVIVGNTKKTPLDECGRVYKDLDEVLRVLEHEGIARVAHRMYPVANMKGMD